MSMQAVLAPYLTSQWGKRAAFAAIGLAALLLLLSLTHGVEWLITLPSQANPDTQTVNVTSKPLPNIADMHLFGAHQVAVAPSQVANLPPTPLQLTLDGLFASANVKKSSAVISAPGHPMKTYRVGDAVPGGATVYQILTDGVILQRNGHLEKLTLPGNPLKFGPAPSSNIDFQPEQP